mmetsp:Transcript_7472/g.26154  ORF Transcript_7472/g.26154 Transcript_7472/m.26154 type:complete len:211 (+) Transcript_7472:461-1093(+)
MPRRGPRRCGAQAAGAVALAARLPRSSQRPCRAKRAFTQSRRVGAHPRRRRRRRVPAERWTSAVTTEGRGRKTPPPRAERAGGDGVWRRPSVRGFGLGAAPRRGGVCDRRGSARGMRRARHSRSPRARQAPRVCGRGVAPRFGPRRPRRRRPRSWRGRFGRKRFGGAQARFWHQSEPPRLQKKTRSNSAPLRRAGRRARRRRERPERADE